MATVDMKSRLIDFMDEVEIGGVKELYRSNFSVVRVVWIIILCLGSFTTAWYTHKTIVEYNKSPTGTKVYFASDRQYEYPNIVLCPNKWIDFVNVRKLGLTVEALMYGLSHIFSYDDGKHLFDDINSDSGKNEFLEFIESKGIEDYLDFYKLLSKEFKQVFEVVTHLDKNIYDVTKVFFMKQICFIVRLPKRDCSLQTVIHYPLLTVYFADNAEREYSDLNMTDDSDTVYVNPDLKFPGSSGHKMAIYPQSKYVIKLFSLKKYTRINVDGNSCKEDDSNNSYSQNFCHSDCLQHLFFKPYKNCLTFGMHKKSDADDKTLPMCNWATLNFSEPDKDIISEIAEVCSAKCIPSCTQNLMEASMTAEFIGNNPIKKIKNVSTVSTIKIIYDVCVHGIMVYEEFNRYSFENLIADIGGLIGLWLGASAITFIQIVMFLFELCVLKVKGKAEAKNREP